MQNALYISPSRCTLTADRSGRERSALQRAMTKENLSDNSFTGAVSEQSQRKIRLAVQWMVTLARRKYFTDPESKKVHAYRCGLVTVSLPTGNESVDPAFFRSTLISSLLDAMGHHFGLRNYIWKIERQVNGTLHAHITVDEWIPYKWLNQYWCKILDKHGLLAPYIDRFASMSPRDYVQYRLQNDHANAAKRHSSFHGRIKSILLAFRKNSAVGWKRPNCTDVHSVKNVRNLAAYMSKYLSKDPKLGDDFKGRFWACSHTLSKLRSVKVGYDDHHVQRVAQCLTPIADKCLDLWATSKIDGEPYNYASVVYLRRDRAAVLGSQLLGPVFKIIRRLYHNCTKWDPPEFWLDAHFELQTKPFNFN